jgi:hypothetical protein
MKVPFTLPAKLYKGPSDPKQLTAFGDRTPQNSAFVKERMLTLLRERLHPTAYSEGPYRFNYTDRSEPCYTGRVHDGRQNLTCHLASDGKIYALCFSTTTDLHGDVPEPCRSKALYLGDLYEDNLTFRSAAIVVDMEYLGRDRAASTPALLAEVAAGRAVSTDSARLNSVIDRFVLLSWPNVYLCLKDG